MRLRTFRAVGLILNREPLADGMTSTDDNQTQRPPIPLTAMYCKEEGLEGLQQRYIKVHGFCRLPRAHAGESTTVERKCNRCKCSRDANCPEEALKRDRLQHCQKGQYMLVRLPPHCKVKWNHRDLFHDVLTRFHAKGDAKNDKDITEGVAKEVELGVQADAINAAADAKDAGADAKKVEVDVKKAEVDAKNAEVAAIGAEEDAKIAEDDARNAGADAEGAGADAKKAKADAKRAEADTKRNEASARRAEAYAKKVEVDVKKAEVDAKNAEVAAIGAEEDAKSAEDDARNAGADAEGAGADAKKAKADAKRAEADAKRAEANAKKAEAEAKKAEADAKTAEAEAKDAEYNVRKATASAHKAHISNYDLSVAGSQNLIKSFVALVQLFSIIRILRADPLNDYGAYQLTLIPYALMSLVNVVSGFLSPSYPAVYMVDSTVMREAQKRGGKFDGVIGQLDEDEDDKTMRKIKAKGDELETKSPDKNDSERWGRRKRPYSMISFGDFYGENNDVFRIAGYFHHLGRTFPLLRLLKDPFLLERFRRNNFHRLTSGSPHYIKERREKRIITSQRIFQALFNEKPPKAEPAKKYLAVLEIGNARHTPPVNSLLAFFMDVVIIIALAIPYVTIYALTKFNAPSGQERVHGIVFMLWLAIGELLPFFLMPSWNLINLEIWRIKLNWRIFYGFLCTLVFTMAPLAGFYFVGVMRYHDLSQHNINCSKSRRTLVLMSLPLTANSCCKKRPCRPPLERIDFCWLEGLMQHEREG